MKKLSYSVLALALFGSAFSAQAELSANIGATSNYLWRGVTQTGNDAAISGGLDYSNSNGFYAGTWVSNIDWGQGSGTEVDFYLGMTGESNGLSYDFGYGLYTYPESEYDDSNFGELYLKGGYESISFGVAYTITSDADNDAIFGTGDIYLHAGYETEIAKDLGLSITVGHYMFDEDEKVHGDNDYSHVQVDISKGDFTFTLSKAQEESGDDDAKFVVSWGQSF